MTCPVGVVEFMVNLLTFIVKSVVDDSWKRKSLHTGVIYATQRKIQSPIEMTFGNDKNSETCCDDLRQRKKIQRHIEAS